MEITLISINLFNKTERLLAKIQLTKEKKKRRKVSNN